ncbi:Ig-like domain-containing protein [Bacillus sp. FJAT-27445]|uniref:Ig-like domain-containing protein n=1 Tax=Bacillus sp. FJAT-27445 TaxID=1679166 RepID=UPI00074350F1|nr:Ig-like domain-containing protein [Bacillus sp. FJAT-27445]
MKKKAIKIAAASAVAASAFVAYAPAQADAATNVATEVSKAVTQIKKAYHTYSDVTATGKFADLADVYKEYNAAKIAYNNAKAIVNKAGGAQKEGYLAQLDVNYNDYIAKRVVTYIDAYNYATALDAKREALAKALTDKDWNGAEKLYHEISYELKTRTVILHRVYGESTRELLIKAFKNEAQALRDSLAEEVTVKMYSDVATKKVAEKDIEGAKAALAKVDEFLPKVDKDSEFGKYLIATAAQVKTAYDALITPKVDGISATNLKEVTVNFNSPVSKADVKTSDFTVKNNTVALVKLSADNKSATLTLGTAVAQQGEVEVTTKTSLKFENGKTLAEAVVSKINVMDVTIPVAESIALTGPNSFTVKFSEPVQATNNAEVLINNGVYGVTSKVLSADGRTLTVTLGASSLPEGTYQVKVSGYADFANFAAMSKTFDLEYKKDVAAPNVKLVSASQSEVVVEFDKAVTQKGGAALTKDFFYHTYSAWKPVAVETTDNKKFTLKFMDNDDKTQDFILPEGNVTVTVLKNVGDFTVVDQWGNAMAEDAKLSATIAADKVAPTVTKVEATAENKVVVTFSEKIDASTAKFAIKDSAGKAITPAITDVAFDNEKLTATLTLGAKLAGGTYTIEVKDAVDTSLSKNKMTAITVPFTVSDKTPIDLTKVDAKVVTNDAAKEQYIYVTFNEAVATSGAYSALSKDNYLVNGTALAAADKVELFGTDNKRVRITVKYRGETPAAVVDAAVDSKNDLTIGRIADAAGNINAALATNFTITNDTAPTTFTAKAVGLNKLELVFGAELKTVTADGILVDGSDTDTTRTSVAAVDKVEVKDGQTYVTVTVKAGENLANKSAGELAKMSVGVVANKLETITGQKLDSMEVTAGNVKDGIAPELASVDPVTVKRTADTEAVITVSFDEALATVGDLEATDFVVTDANGKVYVAGVDYTVDNSKDASKVEIKLTLTKANLDKLAGTKFTVATKATVTYLQDGSKNKVKAFEAKATKTALSATVEQ